MENQVTSVTHVIQLAVAPVFLLTAIATVISVLNVRLGRIVDRQRAVRAPVAADQRPLAAIIRQRELALLERRCRLSYLAILCAVIAGLFVCMVVALAFIGVLLGLDLHQFLAVLFVLAMVSMITSLSVFLREIYVAVSGRERVDAAFEAEAASAAPET
jgi:hypothetical protein